jgi:hypothetical protein
MRNSLLIYLAVVVVTQFAAACDQRGSVPKSHDDAEAGSPAAPNEIVLTIKDVLTTGYALGLPTNCTIVFDAANNTGADLHGASLALGRYLFSIAALPRRSEYSTDDMLDVQPISNSCTGVVAALQQDVHSPGVSSCSLAGASPEDCASKIAVFTEVGEDAKADIRAAEQAAARQYRVQLAESFQRARSQAWAQRGQYQVGTGAALASAHPETPMSLAAVRDPDFDPSKAGRSAVASIDLVSFCPPDPNARPIRVPATGPAAAVAPPRPTTDRLVVLKAQFDQFGLANWYDFRLLCDGRPPHTIWMKASEIEALLQAGRVVKQASG